MILGLEDFNRQFGRRIDGMKVYIVEMEMAKEMLRKEDCFVFGKNNRQYLKDVKTITWELQHRLVATDLDKKKVEEVAKNEQTVKRRVWELKETI